MPNTASGFFLGEVILVSPQLLVGQAWRQALGGGLHVDCPCSNQEILAGTSGCERRFSSGISC
jgi:hypothetical protein